MPTELARKLRLTAAALGCTTRRELAARFVAVNAASQCNLARLELWMEGRSMPRSPKLYDDWAKVLGSSRPGRWLARCTLDDFLDEVAALSGVHAEDLRGRDAVRPAVVMLDRGNSGLGDGRVLCGAFACYSHAFSPLHQGQIIRGALRIHRAGGTGLRAIYSETLLGDTIRVVGEVAVAGGAVHMLLREPESELPLFVSLILPGPPANVLCGIMAGPAFVARDALPTSTRFVAIRVPEATKLEPSNRYLSVADESFVGDLGRLGLNVGSSPGLDDQVAAFLGAVPDQVRPADHATIAHALDPLFSSPSARA
jgi:hypothetical protein